MKYVFLLLFAACAAKTNPKEAIVERQKAIKKEIAAMQDSARNNPMPDTGRLTEEQIANSKHVFFLRQGVRLEKEYDSLNMELKKY